MNIGENRDMTKYALDTSAWIELFTGSDKGLKIKNLIDGCFLITSSIALAEVVSVFKRKNMNSTKYILYMSAKSKIDSVTVDIAKSAGELHANIREKKPKFGLMDAIHLSTAKANDAVFITCDHDFSESNAIIIS